MSYRSIRSILTHGLDQSPLATAAATRLPPTHENVRGAAYYADAGPPTDTPAAAPLSLITGDQ
jgi:hypothetical protein